MHSSIKNLETSFIRAGHADNYLYTSRQIKI